MEGFYELNQILDNEIKRRFIFSDFKITKEYSAGRIPFARVDGTHLAKKELKFTITADSHVFSSEERMIEWWCRAVCIMEILSKLPSVECSMKLRVDYNPNKRKSNERLSKEFYKEMGAFFTKNFLKEMVAGEIRKFLKANKVPWENMPLEAFILPNTITISGKNKFFEAMDDMQDIANQMKNFLGKNANFFG